MKDNEKYISAEDTELDLVVPEGAEGLPPLEADTSDSEPVEDMISPEEKELLPSEVESLMERHAYAELRELFEGVPAVDLAELFANLDPKYRPLLFRLLHKAQAAATFVEMDSDLCRELVEGFNDSELSAILDEMYLDDTVDMIEEMPAAVVKRILRASRPEDRAIINRLLRYDKDSAGAIMTTEYVRLRPKMTVGQALEQIRKVAIDKETIYTCYVTDGERHLEGIVTARALLINPSDMLLEEIMEENVIFVRTGDDREECARMFDKYGFIALPVVDSEHRLVGIVTVDDAMAVIREETEEDFAKMAAVTPTETPYLRTGVFAMFKSRIPWLLLLMISATFSSMILSRFEAALPAVLVLFVPMLMDTGGNSGGQSSVTVIRAMSLGEIRSRDALKVVWKELRIGIISGIILGGVALAKVLLVDRMLMGNTSVTVTVAFTVAIALAITVIMAKLIGSTLPILAKLVGFDPAVMASPIITTLVDALALLLYFAISASLVS
jgi:magnesium transporter